MEREARQRQAQTRKELLTCATLFIYQAFIAET